MTKINTTAIGAALIAASYANTAAGFRHYADDKYTPTTPLNDVVRALDPTWEGNFGDLTVADADQVETLDELFQVNETAGEFLNSAPQVGEEAAI